MNRDRVLVALDRKEAAHVWERSVHGGLDVADATSDAFRAALDTDREELEARITAVVHREYERRRKQGITICSPSSDAEVEQWRPLARAVLALLENGGQE